MWEKKSKCPKKNFQSVERGKKCKCRISGVRKKKELKKKKEVPRKKNQSVLGWKFWNFRNKNDCLVRKKNDKNFQSIFRVVVCALHTLGRHVDWKVQSHGLIGKLKLRLLREKKSGIFIYWVRTHWLGAMLWTNQKLGAIL